MIGVQLSGYLVGTAIFTDLDLNSRLGCADDRSVFISTVVFLQRYLRPELPRCRFRPWFLTSAWLGAVPTPVLHCESHMPEMRYDQIL